MSRHKGTPSLSRRGLLKGATLAGAAAVGNPLAGRAQETPIPNRALAP
jgi:hypothetical protein